MRTFLEVKHRNKDGLIMPDSYQGWSRSFTKKFIELLYCSFANILAGAPYTMTDIIGCTTRKIDVSQPGYAKTHMLLFGPGGYGFYPAFDGNVNSAPFGRSWLPGHMFGIMVGRSATAVTPNDIMLNDRIHHGTHGSVGITTNMDSYLTGGTGGLHFTTTGGFIGMLYKPQRSFTLQDVQFQLWRTGSPGNVTANIIAITPSGPPPNSDTAIIATSGAQSLNAITNASPGALVTFTFASPPYLQAGFVYLIVLTPSQASGGNYFDMYLNNTTVYHPYVGFYQTFASLGAAITQDLGPAGFIPYYQLDGVAGAEMEYGSTDLLGASYVISNPNAVFTIRRIFWNNSGEAMTVQESGIYLIGSNYTNLGNDIYPFCAAHDTFAGIAVADGESIEVDYTPSIHI